MFETKFWKQDFHRDNHARTAVFSIFLSFFLLLACSMQAKGDPFCSENSPRLHISQWQLRLPQRLGAQAHIDVNLLFQDNSHLQIQANLDANGEHLNLVVKTSETFRNVCYGDLAIVSVFNDPGLLSHTYRVVIGGGVVIVVLSDD